MPKVEFLFDFGSPNAYLSHLVVPTIEKRFALRVDYVPILLGGVFKLTNNRSPAETNAGIKNKPQYLRLETERFLRKHMIKTFKWNPFFPVNTLTVMRGAIAAQQIGIFERYVDAIFHHMWAEPKKLDDPDVLRTAMTASGLPVNGLLELLQTPAIKEALMAQTQRAVDRGTFGVPTFFVEGAIFFGKDGLRDVEEEIDRVREKGIGSDGA
jgi:2-hydroxychromene-2-carboxylate isomerase